MHPTIRAAFAITALLATSCSDGPTTTGDVSASSLDVVGTPTTSSSTRPH